MKKNIIATIAGLAVTIAITFLFHRIVMGEQFKIVFEKIGRPQDPVAAILGYLILVAGTVYLFPKVYDGGSPAVAGYKLGALLGLVFITPMAWMFYLLEISMSTIISDVLWHIFVEHAVAGLVIGMTLGGDRKQSVTLDADSG